MNKQERFEKILQALKQHDIRVADSDYNRPWGGFLVIDEDDADKFIQVYFPMYKKQDLMLGNKLSPKILVVAPSHRLSWQYHHRRAEIWRVIEGEIGVVQSPDDLEQELKNYKSGEVIVLPKGTRHRLVGLKDWGILAEIWQHTDKEFPSDENDIIRLQDDYGR